MLQGLDAPVQYHGLRPADRLRQLPRAARDLSIRVEPGQRRVRRHRSQSGARQAGRSAADRHDPHHLQGPDAARDEQRRAGHHQRAHQGRDRQGEEGLLHAGPRRARHAPAPIASATRRSPRALGRDNFTVDKLVLAQQKDVPADATVVVIAGPQTDFLGAGDRCAEALRREGRQDPGDDRSAGAERRRSGEPARLPERLGDRLRQRHRRRRQRRRPDLRRRRVGAGRGHLPAAPDHRGLPRHDRVPAGAIGAAGRRRRRRPQRRSRSCRPVSRAGRKPI